MFKYILMMLGVAYAVTIQADDFAVAGNSIRNTVIAQVDGNQVLYVSELDGGVSCYTLGGKKIWRVPTEKPAILFEIEAADVNGDGNEDLLAASGNGSIRCWDHSGKRLWKFTPDHKVRFSEVAAVKNGKKVQIFAGGNDGVLYELNTKGKLVSETKISYVVRKLEAGDFLKDGEESLFLMTYNNDKFRWDFMGILDPETKKPRSELSFKSRKVKNLSKAMVTDISVADLDKDGRDDLLFFGDVSWQSLFVGLNGDFELLAEHLGSNREKQRYAHAIGTCLLPAREEVVLQWGGILSVLDLKGKLLHKTGKKYDGLICGDWTLEPESGQLIASGQVGGGNGLYFYDLKKDDWWQTEHPLLGRMSEVKENLDTLYQQALDFEMPVYQQRSDKPWVMITGIAPTPEVAELDGAEIQFARQIGMQEKTDRAELVAAMGEVALKKDKRKQYNMSQSEIVALAREHEKNGEPFTAWTGHGNDPFITTIDTMEQVLEAAPNTCYGFIYAEMHNLKDPRVLYFIDEYVPRLAKAMRKHGKAKLYFRYKNMFWAATSHERRWKDLFFSGKYADILVPCAEDTSSRTQELNFVGRVGMFAGGYVNDYGMRLVDDNPTSWRPLTPGGQRSVSPYLRNGALMAAYGSRYGVIFGSGFTKKPDLNVLFALMKSGVLPVVEKEDVLSISSWHLIDEVDTELVHAVDDHHNLKIYAADDDDAVFSVAQMHWAGADLPEYDFSRQALGVEYRWMNYLPIMPHGMVPVAPVESAPMLKKQGVPFTVSDAKVGYVNGKKVPASQLGPRIGKAARAGAQKMPVVVSGAAWSAIRLDAKHIRVVLVDPGYIDPQERAVTITLQGALPVSAMDILSKDALEMDGNKIALRVPAGSMRFVDLAY